MKSAALAERPALKHQRIARAALQAEAESRVVRVSVRFANKLRSTMQARRKLQRGDAFDRALKESFGEQATLATVEQARQLYARYRTDDMLERLKAAVGDKGSESGRTGG